MPFIVNYFGAALAAVAFVCAASWDFDELAWKAAFLAWVLSPFLLTHAALMWKRDAVGRAVGLTLTSILFAIPYLEFIVPIGRRSSTEALAFLFVPLWHHCGIIIVVGVTFLWSLLRRSTKPRNGA